jgi:hypothetical protein
MERIRRFVRKLPLATLPLLAALPGCGNPPEKHPVETSTPETSVILVLADEKTKLQQAEAIIAKDAHQKGQGVVFLLVTKPTPDVNVIINLKRIDEPSKKDTYLDIQSGVINTTVIPEGKLLLQHFYTASCDGVYKIIFSIDSGKTYRQLLVPAANDTYRPTFSLGPKCEVYFKPSLAFAGQN